MAGGVAGGEVGAWLMHCRPHCWDGGAMFGAICHHGPAFRSLVGTALVTQHFDACHSARGDARILPVLSHHATASGRPAGTLHCRRPSLPHSHLALHILMLHHTLAGALRSLPEGQRWLARVSAPAKRTRLLSHPHCTRRPQALTRRRRRTRRRRQQIPRPQRAPAPRCGGCVNSCRWYVTLHLTRLCMAQASLAAWLPSPLPVLICRPSACWRSTASRLHCACLTDLNFISTCAGPAPARGILQAASALLAFEPLRCCNDLCRSSACWRSTTSWTMRMWWAACARASGGGACSRGACPAGRRHYVLF